MPDLEASTPNRAIALDALRGIAVLAMVFSGILPFGGALPAWMYHAQVPPPEHSFNPEVPGLTWVDWVFPAFLFAMGAAIPLAQQRRRERGWGSLKIARSLLWRGISLLAFAIFLQHLRPTQLDPDLGTWRWILSLLGFLILGLACGRFPKTLSPPLQRGVNLLGWLAGILLLSQLQYPDGSGFSLGRNDIILVVLANVAVVGTVLWWLTRHSALGRLGVMAVVLALQMSYETSGWVQTVFSATPLPGLLEFAYLKYLLVVLPGTLIGDRLWEWTHSEDGATSPPPLWRDLAIALLGLGWTLTLLVGLQGRWVGQTVLLSLVWAVLAFWLVRKPHNASDRLLQHFLHWGSYWIGLGLAWEPFQGGIKKDPATFSYLFVTTGISILLLATLTVVVQRGRKLQLFVETGRNPLVGYSAYLNFILPILTLTGVRNLINAVTASPLRGTIRAVLLTLLVAWLVRGFNRLGWFWKV